jgi:hypothetical protein
MNDTRTKRCPEVVVPVGGGILEECSFPILTIMSFSLVHYKYAGGGGTLSNPSSIFH